MLVSLFSHFLCRAQRWRRCSRCKSKLANIVLVRSLLFYIPQLRTSVSFLFPTLSGLRKSTTSLARVICGPMAAGGGCFSKHLPLVRSKGHERYERNVMRLPPEVFKQIRLPLQAKFLERTQISGRISCMLERRGFRTGPYKGTNVR